MSITELPFRLTTAQACDWLAEQTASPWDLARLIGNGLTPYVWLDYDAAYPDLFGDANGGYAAPIFYEADTRRLIEGSSNVLITMTKDVHKLVTTLPAPGFRRGLDELRFLKKEVEKLAGRIKHAVSPAPAKPAAARESQLGINQAEVLAAFGALVRIDLAQALASGENIFGDDGARLKASVKKGKAKTLWNPVTLALGLNDNYRVPLPQLTRAFAAHDFLDAWSAQWQQSLALLGR